MFQIANPDFQLIFNSMPGNVLVLQPNAPDYNILAVSDELLKIINMERDNVIGKSIFKIYPENHLSNTATRLSNLRASIQDAHLSKVDNQLPLERYDIPNLNGGFEVRFWSASNRPILDNQGEVSYILHTTTDTTEKLLLEKTESKLRQVEKTYSLFMQAPLAICIVTGPENIIELANKETLEILGKTNEIVGKPLSESLPLDLKLKLTNRLEMVRKTCTSHTLNEYETTLMKSGKKIKRFYNFLFQPYFEKPHDLSPAGVFAMAHDVTEQVLARKKVEESELQIRSIVDNAPLAIGLYVGPEMVIQFANQIMLNIFGKGSNIIGQKYADVLPDLNPEIYKRLDDVYTTGIPFHAEKEKIYLADNGELKPFYYTYTFTPLFDSNSRVYGVMNIATDVTDLSLVQEKIGESESRFRNMVKQAPVAITLTRGKDIVVESINKHMLRIMGKEHEEEVIGKAMIEILPEIKDQPIVGHVLNVLETGESFSGSEVPVTLLNGDKLENCFFNVSYTPLIEKNVVTGVIHIAIDVTEQVLARKKVEEERERARLAIEVGKLGVFEANLKTMEVTADSRFDEIIGLKASMTRDQYVSAIHPDDIQIREKALREGMVTGSFEYEVRVNINHTEYKWVKVQGRVFNNDANEPVKAIGVAVDTTAHKNYAEELKKFKIISDYAFDAFILMREDGTFAYLNDLALKRWGYTKKEATLIKVPDVDPIYQKEKFDAAFALAQKQIIPPFETIHKRKDGTTYPVEISMGGITLEGKPHMFAIARDLTERKQAEETLKKRNEELQVINNDLDNFIYTASHDLKAPISNIEGLLSLLSEDILTGNTQEDDMQHIMNLMQKSVDRFKKTIDSLTDVVKLQQESGIPAVLVNVSEIIQEVSLDLNPLIQDTNTKLEIEISNCSPIRFSAKNLRSVIYNLLSNAIKYRSPERAPHIILNCQSTSDSLYHILSISDNGLGIDINKSGELFNMFKRFHDHVEGTGIGLYMVKKMVENAGGRIEVESQLNKGTTFCVYFKK